MSEQPYTVDDIDAEYQPNEITVKICVNTKLSAEIERREEELEEVKERDEISNAEPQAPALAAELIKLREQALVAERPFTFQSIGFGPYERLIAQHPLPDDADQTLKAKSQRYNWRTFAPALLAASCTSPAGATEAWWTAKLEEWNGARIILLWNACVAAQEGYVGVPKAELAYELMGTSA